MKRLLNIFLLLFIVISFTGCQAYEPISPHGYYSFLIKAKEFLAFCVYIANTDNPYWGQIFSRLYYAYFTLARIVHIGKTGQYEQEKHTVIWQQNKKEVRKKYGETLKHLRTYYDYDYASNTESIEELSKNLSFILDNRKAFDQLINDTNEQIEKFYKHERDKIDWNNKCKKEIESIIRAQNDLEKVLNNWIERKN